MELWPALVALGGWGARHATEGGPPREFFHEACGTVVEAAVHCPHCDVNITAEEAGSRPGPGWREDPSLPEELGEALGRPRPLLAAARTG